MLKRDIDKLNNNRWLLFKHLKLSDDFYNCLRRDGGVLNGDLESEIKEKPPSSRVGHLLDVISKRGTHAFDALLNAMYTTGQVELLSELQPGFDARRVAINSMNVKMKTDNLKVGETMKVIQMVEKQPSPDHGTPHSAGQRHHNTKPRENPIASDTNPRENPTASDTDPPDIDQIVDAINQRIQLSYDSNIQDVEHNNSINLPWDIFCLKSKSEFIAGQDLECLQYFKTISTNKKTKFCKLISKPVDIDKYLREIMNIIDENSLLSCTILIDSDNNKDSFKLKDGSLPVSEVIAKIKNIIKIELLIIICFYGPDHFDGRNLTNINDKAVSQPKGSVIISQLEDYDKRKHWMLWALVECFKISKSNKCILDEVWSLLLKVGKRSAEKNIVSTFHFSSDNPRFE